LRTKRAAPPRRAAGPVGPRLRRHDDELRLEGRRFTGLRNRSLS
jgi:hypothetical protein